MPRILSCRLFFCAALCLSAVCRAQSSGNDAPGCPWSALDIHALPPAVSSPIPDNHLTVLEIQNTGSFACRLGPLTATLLPEVNDYGQVNPWFDPEAPGYHILTLVPQGWSHVLIAWTSQLLLNVDCAEHSGIRLRPNGLPNLVPSDDLFFEIRNLPIRSCGSMYLSDQRPGRYHQNSLVSKSWPLSPAKRTDFKLPLQNTGTRISENPPLHLRDSVPRMMIGDYFQLRLGPEMQSARNCPLRLIRMRESNGHTVVALQNCAETDLPALKSARWSTPNRVGITPVILGLAPHHTGPVQYEAVAQIGNSGEYSAGRIEIMAHDPTAPTQAAIVNPLPMCIGSQLKLTALPTVATESWKTLRAYEAANTSDKTCAVAGVPAVLEILDNVALPFFPKPCPNCANDLFKPRPNGYIDLQPGQKAHFLVAATTFDTEGGSCCGCSPLVENFQFKATKESPPVILPLGALACAALDVSAWREGAFDQDPLNIRWAAMHEPDPALALPIPPNCNKPGLLLHGRPHMDQTSAFGLSTPKPEFAWGEKVVLNIWADNTTDATVGVWTCMGLDFFRAFHIDLYDGYGHRVLRKQEASHLEKCKTNPSAAAMEYTIRACARNFPIPIAAHTCVTDDNYDFTLDLSQAYDLPPGEYTVRMHPDQGSDGNACSLKDEPPIRPTPADLTFRVIGR